MTGRQPAAPGHRIVRAHPADTEDLSQLIADAFFPLAPCQWLIPDAGARRDILPAFFRLHVEHAMADGLVDTTPGRDAAALWIPTAAQPPAPPEGYHEHLARITGPWAQRFAAFDTELDAHHLAILAVRPGRQAAASAPRSWPPTTRPWTRKTPWPTWKHPAKTPAASTCTTATPTTAPPSSCPAGPPHTPATTRPASSLTARGCTR
jgi:hypothetical protein